MRKNTARHWLHAGLDLLPLILIPVFMIYSHRHTIDSGSIEVPVNKVVDFNQQLPNNTHISFNASNDGWSYLTSISNVKLNDIYILKWYQEDTMTINYRNTPTIQINGASRLYFDTSPNINLTSGFYYWYFTTNNNGQLDISYWLQQNDISVDYIDFQLFNLTQMFGSGNEPTLQQFHQWYPNDYYDYTLSHKELLKDYSTITYDDTDIMSQFTYQMYNAVDKYFNMGNVFGMSNVYDWFNLNIFGGNASISIYIVWNIVLYEFVMDLLFLLYALFMWFIDVTKRLIEKPLDSIK